MVRAKFVVQSNQDGQVKLTAVTNGSEENERFFELTPNGEVKLAIVNSDTAAKFEIGKEYYVDFTEVESA